VYLERVRSAEDPSQTVEQHQTHNFFDYPNNINKKVILLQHFKSYLEGNSKFKPMAFPFTKETQPSEPVVSNLPYVKRWKRAQKAIIFKNTNGVIQLIFSDKSELILTAKSNMVTFINSQRVVKSILLRDSNQDGSLSKRLIYARQELELMMGSEELKRELPHLVNCGEEVSEPKICTPKAGSAGDFMTKIV